MSDYFEEKSKKNIIKSIWRRYNKLILRLVLGCSLLYIFLNVFSRKTHHPYSSAFKPLKYSTNELTDPLTISEINFQSSSLIHNQPDKFDYKNYLDYIKQHNIAHKNIKNILKIANQTLLQSSHVCVGKQNLLAAHDRRACEFRNVCFNTKTKEMEYYQPTQKPVFYDAKEGPKFSFGQNKNDFITMAALWVNKY